MLCWKTLDEKICRIITCMRFDKLNALAVCLSLTIYCPQSITMTESATLFAPETNLSDCPVTREDLLTQLSLFAGFWACKLSFSTCSPGISSSKSALTVCCPGCSCTLLAHHYGQWLSDYFHHYFLHLQVQLQQVVAAVQRAHFAAQKVFLLRTHSMNFLSLQTVYACDFPRR